MIVTPIIEAYAHLQSLNHLHDPPPGENKPWVKSYNLMTELSKFINLLLEFSEKV
jgi:hypothetical protein